MVSCNNCWQGDAVYIDMLIVFMEFHLPCSRIQYFYEVCSILYASHSDESMQQVRTSPYQKILITTLKPKIIYYYCYVWKIYGIIFVIVGVGLASSIQTSYIDIKVTNLQKRIRH